MSLCEQEVWRSAHFIIRSILDMEGNNICFAMCVSLEEMLNEYDKKTRLSET